MEPETTTQQDGPKYWAKFRKTTLGPFGSRSDALSAMREELQGRKVKPGRDEIMTGYGTFGPHFDMQWVRP